MNRDKLRRAVPLVYVAATLLALLFGNGAVVGAVAAVGAIVVCLCFVLLREPYGGPPSERDR